MSTRFCLSHGARLEVLSLPTPGPAHPDREPLVFLHEGLGSVAMWGDWPLALCQATGRAGWVYSRHGYGQSSPVTSVRSPTTTVSGPWGAMHAGRLRADYMHHEAWFVLPDLLMQWGVQRPVLVGHSDGATIALLHASRFPVSAVVALAPHVTVEPICLTAVAGAQKAYETTDLRAKLARYHADVDSAFWQWCDVWQSDAFRAFDIRPDTRSIQAPVLALQGEDDAYGTLAQIDEIGAPCIERHALPRCGHSPHRDQPAATTHHVVRFLATLG